MTQSTYIGNELELFEKAENWKSYYGSFLKPYLKGKVLEAGAGLGGTTKHLCDGTQQEWLCLEPDPELAQQISELISSHKLPDCCRLQIGTLEDISDTDLYDAIIYIDVIEHIEDDAAELRRAYNHLKPGGKLMILVPAHQFLYSPFDKAIGHFRRYNKTMLKNAVPKEFKQKKLVYLDSVGLLASAANKIFLKQSQPQEKQILFWDRVMVTVSRVTDPLTLGMAGKSVLGIWEK
jgi:SAM-dependent methyltransferase